MCKVRGNEVGMVFQDPLTSLNPTMTIGDQIAESARLHQGASKKEGREPGARGPEDGGDAEPVGRGSTPTPTSSRAASASG